MGRATIRTVSLTTEPELTEPVDLCTPDGKALNSQARGWSRLPLHTGNLRGSWGRTKRWDYWAILAPDFVVSVVYADVDYLGMATVWWADLADGRTGGRAANQPLARGISLPDRPGSSPLRYSGKHSTVDIVDDADGSLITATWKESDGTPARLEVRAQLPEGHESVNVVIPWSDQRFQYTSKHQARPATGHLTVGDEIRSIGGETEAWAVLDVGRGRWPYQTTWNWGGGAGQSTAGATVGLQFGAKWTAGTGFTENGVIVDGVVSKIGAELEWTYDWDDPMAPWRVRHPDGLLDVTLTPRYDRHERVNLGVLSTEVHQVFGTWDGTATTADGATHEMTSMLGFAEESRSRW